MTIVKPDKILKMMRKTVVKFDDPLEPVGLEEWEVMK